MSAGDVKSKDQQTEGGRAGQWARAANNDFGFCLRASSSYLPPCNQTNPAAGTAFLSDLPVICSPTLQHTHTPCQVVCLFRHEFCISTIVRVLNIARIYSYDKIIQYSFQIGPSVFFSLPIKNRWIESVVVGNKKEKKIIVWVRSEPQLKQ